jgi:hypothetical protein
VEGLRPFRNQNKIQNLHLFTNKKKTAFERRKSAINFRFKQTSCNTVSESLTISWQRIFQKWLIFPDNIASFPNLPNAKISAFRQTALYGDNTAQPVDLPSSSNYLISTEGNEKHFN